MSSQPMPSWMPSEDGFIAEDLDRLTGLHPHVELIDGGLVLVNPQRLFHMRAVRRLEAGLLAAAPPELEVLRKMSVVLSERQRPEPDLAIVEATAIGGGDQTWYPADSTYRLTGIYHDRLKLSVPHEIDIDLESWR